MCRSSGGRCCNWGRRRKTSSADPAHRPEDGRHRRRRRSHSTVRGQSEAASWLFLRGKATVAQTPDLLDILRDIVLTVSLDNRERFRQMALEERARLEASLVPGGSSYVAQRLAARFTEAGWVSEQTGRRQLLVLPARPGAPDRLGLAGRAGRAGTDPADGAASRRADRQRDGGRGQLGRTSSPRWPTSSPSCRPARPPPALGLAAGHQE